MRSTTDQTNERHTWKGGKPSRTDDIVTLCRLIADCWIDGEHERAKRIRYDLIMKFPTRHDSINWTITNFINHRAKETIRGHRPRRTSELLQPVRPPQLQRVRRMR